MQTIGCKRAITSLGLLCLLMGNQGVAEDRRLVLAAQQGDREAFADLVRKYTGVVRALAALEEPFVIHTTNSIGQQLPVEFTCCGRAWANGPEGWIVHAKIGRVPEVRRWVHGTDSVDGGRAGGS